ncbi:MAG TPA: N-acetylneuraminate synthase family protein [Candidatus Paceibacterota bacterium]|nr:N-acetylneuraminate synthase family protein [Candidatus Paceibacterota bacterium]
MAVVKIGTRAVGDGAPAYIIAEAGVNHNGSLARAKQLIREAAKAGADAIKFQTYKAEKLVTKQAPRFWDWKGEVKKKGTQYDSYSLLDKFPLEHYPELIALCKKEGIEFLSTPFDEDSAKALVKFGMKAIKVSSSDVTNLPFLSYLAKFKLPILLSVGASTLGEIEEAVRVIEEAGNRKIVIMQCTLIYPTPDEHANLRVIPTLASVFPDYPIGLSDHTLGTAIPPAAVALGACMIEKHYTVDKTLGKSADHWLSVDAKELKEMVDAIRRVEKALGSARKYVLPEEHHTYLYDKRSLVAAQDIPEGATITKKMLTHKRPGTGIRPKYLDIVIGRTARTDIPADTTITWDMV